MGEEVLIESTTDHEGNYIDHRHHSKVPASHDVAVKHHKHQHNPPVSYYQQQQLPRIKLQPATKYEEPITIVSTLPAIVPAPAPYNSINLNHVNSLIHEDPVASIDTYASAPVTEPLDTYGSPPIVHHTTEPVSQPVYLPTTTTSNVFLNHNPEASSYQDQLQFLSPAQPASPVFTTATEGLPVYHQGQML